MAAKLLAVMPRGRSLSLEDLLATAGLEADTALARLTALELEGRIRRVPGPGFVRVG